MEKRKLLLVAISAGVFLAVTIGAALFFLRPEKTGSTLAATPAQAAGSIDTGITIAPSPSNQTGISDPVDLVLQSGDVPGLQTAPEGIGTDTLISVPKPSTAAVPDSAPAGRASSPAFVASSRPAAASQSQAKPAAQTKVYNDYWVQTGAFSTAGKAEGVKESLALKGITSIIENREVEGRTLFRVRVGPYTSQTEANYWLSLIKSIEGFEDSQIRQTQSGR